MNDFSPEKEEKSHNHQCRQGGYDRSAERLVDRYVDHRTVRLPPSQAEVFPDPVEHNDRIIQGISYDSEKSSYDDKGYFLAEQREYPEGNNNIMHESYDRSDRELELEAPADIDQDAEHRYYDGRPRAVLEFLTDLGTYCLGTQYLDLPVGESCKNRFFQIFRCLRFDPEV